MVNARNLWANLVGSLWFVPSVLVLAAVLLAVGMVELSAHVDTEALARWPRVFGASADSSRSMLAAIAGSMITVAGVTFSITIVAVTQASSQYTPRILRNFMRDRANQVVLGSFVGIFVYCLVVLRTIRGPDETVFVPSLAVLVGMLLALVGIAVLIFFVHHIATTLQASEIVARIARETIAAVDRQFPDEIPGEVQEPERAEVLAWVSGRSWRPVPATKTGYIQSVDIDNLLRIARDCDFVVRMEQEIGAFVVAGLPLASFAPYPRRRDNISMPTSEMRRAADVLASRFTVSTYRTTEQDASFGLRQLVDIALKAISPGVNDVTTAVTCIEYLGAILIHLANRQIETPHRSDDGMLRLLVSGPTFGELLRLAFEEIRQHARGDVSILAHQLDALTRLACVTRQPVRRAQIIEQVGLIREVVDQTVELPHDRERLEALAARARGSALRTNE